MKKDQDLAFKNPLRYIENTVNVPQQELLSVIKDYGVNPQKIARYLQQIQTRPSRPGHPPHRFA